MTIAATKARRESFLGRGSGFYLLGLLLRLDVRHDILPRPPPRTKHRYHQTRNGYGRRQIGAGIHVPRVLLGGPDAIHEHGVEAGPPEQERRGPGGPRVELVVQRPRAQHANGVCAQDGGHDELGRHALGDLVRGVLIRADEVESERRDQRPARGPGPPGGAEEEEEQNVRGQKAGGECGREEYVLRHEAPVDGPLVEELPV
jgi:hypothetical protein